MTDQRERYPITLWHCNLGVGDGQDLASRGYLRALMAVDYKYVVISPRGTSINHFDKDPDLEPLRPIFGYPAELSSPTNLKRVEAGDPRIGKPWAHLDEAEMLIPAPPHAPANSIQARWQNIVQEGEVDQEYYFAHPEEKQSKYRPVTELVVLHFDPGQLSRARDAVARESEGEVPIVGITAWEADRVPPSIAQQLSDLNALIVPSAHTASAFRSSGLDDECPIFTVPHALGILPLQEEEASAAFSSTRNRYIFYTIGTDIPRKNLRGVIAAYCRAFGPKFENVGLVIKTSGNQDALGKLYKEGLDLAGMNIRPKIAIYGDRWSAERIRALHLQGNCWVDATRGEGFGLGQLEAAAMGNPVITTGWGAQTEVLEQSGIMRTFISYDFRNVDPAMAELGVYREDQMWADPSLEDLADAMRRVAMERWSKSTSQARKLAQQYSLQKVGQKLAVALGAAKQRLALL